MLQCQLKLRLNSTQEHTLEQWLFHLGAVYNWGLRKIELNAKNKIYYPKQEFQNLLAGHGPRLGIPSHTLQGTLLTVHNAWSRCFKKLGGKPRLKSRRRRLNSISFPDPIKAPKEGRIGLPVLGKLRFHKQDIPDGRIKCGRIVRRASGWYLCLFIDAQPKALPRLGCAEIGIDPGFTNLITLSDTEKVEHPRELEITARRLAQAQRGRNRKLSSRLQERIANRRKDRNHKLSRFLVQNHSLIVWSKDEHKKIAKRFGKSVASSAHAQLRQMLKYKSLTSGTEFVETCPKGSTMTCFACGARSGPRGWAGLRVRQWVCPCGAEHDRDINAARNTLKAGAGSALEAA